MSEENWKPALTEYNPNISKEKWLEILDDRDLTFESTLRAFACLYDYGGVATCLQLARRYGGTFNDYLNRFNSLAKKIVDKGICSSIEESEYGYTGNWPALFYGRRTGPYMTGDFFWKLRDELKEALHDYHIEKWLDTPMKRLYWSGGFKWGKENKYKEFTENNYWQCGWEKSDTTKGAKQAWATIEEIRVGDYLSFHSYGGSNDLTISYLSEIIGIEKDEGLLRIKKLNDENYYKGKGPKMGNSSWFGTLFPVLGDEAITKIFHINGGEVTMKKEINNYVDLLKENHNIILHGAPGTGKTFLAKQIAEAMEAEWDMVQFHPSYDYTDFVEGLRPTKINGFERVDGVFKDFCSKAIFNNNEDKALEIYQKYFTQLPFCKEVDGVEIKKYEGKNYFTIKNINSSNEFSFDFDTMKKYFFDSTYTNGFLNDFGLIARKDIEKELDIELEELFEKKEDKKYIFIIDEINRGELSKIFGELFFSIDPGYRGKEGLVNTQYQNLIEEDDVFADGFYVPENVYIIGTMNDIDRSVESMDFAMRRRFVFEEVTAEDSANNMGISGTVRTRMDKMNDVISKMPELGKAYCIGGSYFLKEIEENGTKKKVPVEENDLDKLWKLKIGPLVYEYLRGIEEYTEECSDGVKYQKIKDAFDGKELN